MEIKDLVPMALFIIIFIIILAAGADFTQDFRDDQTAGSYAYNITEDGLEGLEKMGSKTDTVANIVMVVVIIGILTSAFFVYQHRKQ